MAVYTSGIAAYTYRADMYCPDCIVRVMNWNAMDENESTERHGWTGKEFV